MKLQEWTASIIDELKMTGFECSEHQGFPLAKVPDSIAEKVRFLKFRTTFAADRIIYAEGVLFLPAESARRW